MNRKKLILKLVLFFFIFSFFIPLIPEKIYATEESWYQTASVKLGAAKFEENFGNPIITIPITIDPPLDWNNANGYGFRLLVDNKVLTHQFIANEKFLNQKEDGPSHNDVIFEGSKIDCVNGGEPAYNTFKADLRSESNDAYYVDYLDSTNPQASIPLKLVDRAPSSISPKTYQIEIFGITDCNLFPAMWFKVQNKSNIVTYTPPEITDPDKLRDALLDDAYRLYAKLVVDIKELFTEEGTGEEKLKYWDRAMTGREIQFLNFALDVAPTVVARFFQGLINITPEVPEDLKQSANLAIDGFTKYITSPDQQYGSDALMPTEEGVALIDTISNTAKQLLDEGGIIDRLEAANPDSEGFMSPMVKFLKSIPQDGDLDKAQVDFKAQFGDPIKIVQGQIPVPGNGTPRPAKDYAFIPQYFLAPVYNPKIFEGGIFKVNPDYDESTAFTKALRQSFTSIAEFRTKIQSVYNLFEQGVGNYVDSDNPDICESRFLTGATGGRRNLAGFMICVAAKFIDDFATSLMKLGLGWISSGIGL